MKFWVAGNGIFLGNYVVKFFIDRKPSLCIALAVGQYKYDLGYMTWMYDIEIAFIC